MPTIEITATREVTYSKYVEVSQGTYEALMDDDQTAQEFLDSWLTSHDIIDAEKFENIEIHPA